MQNKIPYNKSYLTGKEMTYIKEVLLPSFTFVSTALQNWKKK